MKILAFDTALGGCSVGVIDTDSGQLTTEIRPMLRGQSEVLVPMVQDMIAKSGLAFADLDLIVTTVGPGAFTGLRIGLSTARSFGLALDIPVDGVLTTEVIATQYIKQNKDLKDDFLVLIETKREDFYSQIFSHKNKPLEDPFAVKDEVLLERFIAQNLTVCGDGLTRCRAALGNRWPAGWRAVEGLDLIHPEAMAEVAAARRRAGNPLPTDPVYLRGADVSQSSRPVRAIATAKS